MKNIVKVFVLIIAVTVSYVSFAVNIIGEEPEKNTDGAYLISKPAHLIWMSNRNSFSTKEVFILMENIDMSGVTNFKPIGQSTSTSKQFHGVFDGNHKVISNLSLEYTSKTDNVGLFGAIHDGQVKDLTISNMRISVSQGGQLGFIVGKIKPSTTKDSFDFGVFNCTVMNSTIESSCNDVGGIVGQIDGKNLAHIEGCVTTNVVISGNSDVGAICGETYTNDVIIKDNMILGGIVLFEDGKEKASKINGHNNDYEGKYNNVDLSTSQSPMLPLVVGRWNFVGNYTNNEDLKVGSLNNNGETPFDYTSAHDMAAKKFDYSQNIWDTNYLLAKDGGVLLLGRGIFVWPFEKDVKRQEMNKKTGEIIYWTQAENKNENTSCIIDITNNGERMNGEEKDEDKGAFWFALSNPFPFPLEVKDIMSGFDNIQGENAVYVWDGNTGKWVSSVKYVYPGQGFMVATANNDRNLHGKLQKAFVKAGKEDGLMVFNCVTDNSSFNMFAKMADYADKGFDRYDSYSLFSSNSEDFAEPYFSIDGRCIVKNIFKTLPYECSFNIKSGKDNRVTVSVANLPKDVSVILIDLLENTQTVLDDTVYTADIYEGLNENRFRLHFINTNSSLSENVSDSVKIWNNGRQLNICGDIPNGADRYMEIIDMTGKVLLHRTLISDCYREMVNLPQGMYFIKVRNSADGKEFVEKFVLTY